MQVFSLDSKYYFHLVFSGNNDTIEIKQIKMESSCVYANNTEKILVNSLCLEQVPFTQIPHSDMCLSITKQCGTKSKIFLKSNLC